MVATPAITAPASAMVATMMATARTVAMACLGTADDGSNCPARSIVGNSLALLLSRKAASEDRGENEDSHEGAH